jgi:Glycosyl transferase family 2
MLYCRSRRDPGSVSAILTPRSGLRIVLVSTMRNEGPYILEWVAYHLAIGFTDLVVCTNDCIDASPLLLDRLQALGLVTHLANQVGPEDKPQLAAYARAQDLSVVRHADWAMVLDADEFLNIHAGEGTVTDLIEAVPQATAFLLNWRIFGHSGHETWSPGCVTERFTRAAALGDAVNRSFKTLFTKIDAYGCKLLPHQPRFPDEARMSELCYVNGAGTVLPRYFYDESRADFLQSEPDQVSWKLAQINHYNTRSWEDYLVKHHRGGGLNISWGREANWVIFNKNDETDVTISNKLDRARAILSRLLRDGELKRRHERCCELYHKHIAALRRQLQTGKPEHGRQKAKDPGL